MGKSSQIGCCSIYLQSINHRIMVLQTPNKGLRAQERFIWVFPKIVVPQNGCFIMENLIKMDDLGVKPPFSETAIYYPPLVITESNKTLVLDRWADGLLVESFDSLQMIFGQLICASPPSIQNAKYINDHWFYNYVAAAHLSGLPRSNVDKNKTFKSQIII